MRGALWVGAIVAAWVFMRLVSVDGVVLSNCVPIPDQPGAVVCGGRVERRVALAAGAEPTLETIIAGPLPTREAVTIPAWALPSCRALWPEFVAAGAEFGVDPALVMIVGLIESGCGQAQASGAGAQGVMQVMPAPARGIALQLGERLPSDWMTNKPVNIRLGAQYLAGRMKAYGQPESADPDYVRAVRLASIGYNGGPGMAAKAAAGRAIASESEFHARWVSGMWAERHRPASATLEEWCAMTRWCGEREQ